MKVEALSQSNETILAVDLDGTLVNTDTLHESIIKIIRQRYLNIFLLFSWLLLGKARFKDRIARNVDINPTLLPYNKELLEWLVAEKKGGRVLVLCTAANHNIGQAVSTHLRIFDHVIASDETTNYAGRNKRLALEKLYGEKGFDYIGNSRADIPVWMGSRRAIIVNASSRLVKRVKEISEVIKIIPRKKSISPMIRALRPHQWIKNVLIFVPLIAAHEGFPIDLCKQLFFAFMAFNFCASSVYLINDLLDIDSDRRHPRKAQRPLASGALSIKNGVILAIASASVSLALAITLVNSNFILWLSIYFLTTFAYTSILKKIAIVDCLTLSALYTLRIIAGAATIIIPLSFWLLAFSLFIFFSLALAKRYTELLIDPSSISKKIYGRGYFTSDAPYILILGLSASFASVLVLALYLNSDKVLKLYQTPEFAFGAIPPMLFWLSYIWLKAFRGELDDDPIVFAARNKTSWITLALIIFFLTLASFS